MANTPKLNDIHKEFIAKKRTYDRQEGLNPANHNTETKRYSKLSLSLTKKEKEQIEAYRSKNHPRQSISSMILEMLEEKGVFMEMFSNTDVK